MCLCSKTMKMELTEIAHRAIHEMASAKAISSNVLWDMHCVDEKFPPDQNPNQAYNRLAKEYINSTALVRIVDAYQWYNAQVFKLMRAKDDRPFLGLAEEAWRRDCTVRKHLHKTLNFWEEVELGIMVEMRNCVAHHLGNDKAGLVAEWLKTGSSPWKLKDSISIEKGVIKFADSAAITSSSIGIAQISIFDQVVSKEFNLEKVTKELVHFKRAKRG